MSYKIIRFVKDEDIPYILDIYTPYVKNTSITFECTTPTLEIFTKKVKNISSFYPFLVCEVDNKIVGYAYASRLREREAYQWDSELSIYLDNNFLNLGIGKKLYSSLIEILKLQNIYNVYGVITLPNDSSIKLHENLGFREIGIFKNTGFKFNSWHDVIWFEKNISKYVCPPAPIKSIKDINKDNLDEILKKCIEGFKKGKK